MKTPSTPPASGDNIGKARAAAAAQKAAAARADHHRRLVAVGVLVAAVILLVVGITAAVHNAAATRTAAATAASARATGAQVSPSVVTSHGGVLLGTDGVITPTAAQAKDPLTAFPGKVVVSVYADFMCPWCNKFEQTNGKLLEQLRAAGTIVVDFHPVSILDRSSQGTAYSTRSASAAFDIAEHAPKAFDRFVDTMYASQPAEGSSGLSDATIAKIAKDAGVDAGTASHLADGTYQWYATHATDLAKADFAQFSTPTVLVNGAPLTVDWTQPGAVQAAITQASAQH